MATDNLDLTDPVVVVKHPDDSIAVAFDFTPRLAECELVTTCTATAVREGGATLTVAGAAAAAVDENGQKVLVRLSAGVAEVDYLVSATVLTNYNNTLVRQRRVHVRNA